MATPKRAVKKPAISIAEGDSAKQQQAVTIKPPKLQVAEFRLVGTAPYMQNRFANKAEMMAGMAEGTTAKSKRKRTARDYNAEYENAKHTDEKGRCGIPASAFRSAMISACRLVNFKMTLAKLSVFILPDSYDPRDNTPLVLIEGTPQRQDDYCRPPTGGVQIHCRPVWKEWSATLKIRFDADQFTYQDVANLLMRVGMQVGIGEGRPDSKQSAGMGYGTFSIE